MLKVIKTNYTYDICFNLNFNLLAIYVKYFKGFYTRGQAVEGVMVPETSTGAFIKFSSTYFVSFSLVNGDWLSKKGLAP